MSKPDHNTIWVAFACAALAYVNASTKEEAVDQTTMLADALYAKWRERSQSLSLGDEYGGTPGMFGLPVANGQVDLDEGPLAMLECEVPVDNEAWDAGHKAGLTGKRLVNPYDPIPGQADFTWWEAGWHVGMADFAAISAENSPETPEKPLVPPENA